MLLRLEGAVVEAVSTAVAALELLSRESYDLLISDVSMPGMNGYELIAQLRSDVSRPRLRAIAMSGYGRAIDVLNSKVAGFDAHLPKPASIAQLKSALAGIVPVPVEEF